MTNVTNFGAFVDVGVHQDGLVHISALANTFVKDPHQVVKTGDIVAVKVIEIDLQRQRIALSMRLDDEHSKADNTQPNNGKRRSNRPENRRNGNKQNRPSSEGNQQGTMAALFAAAAQKQKR